MEIVQVIGLKPVCDLCCFPSAYRSLCCFLPRCCTCVPAGASRNQDALWAAAVQLSFQQQTQSSVSCWLSSQSPTAAIHKDKRTGVPRVLASQTCVGLCQLEMGRLGAPGNVTPFHPGQTFLFTYHSDSANLHVISVAGFLKRRGRWRKPALIGTKKCCHLEGK